VGEHCNYFQQYWDKFTVELQTLFKRENAADPFFKRTLPSFVPNLIVAHPLFRYQDPNLAGWKTGANEIASLKMALC
jgi:hypothetical protein